MNAEIKGILTDAKGLRLILDFIHGERMPEIVQENERNYCHAFALTKVETSKHLRETYVVDLQYCSEKDNDRIGFTQFSRLIPRVPLR